jgi:hypothetical protein
MSDARDAEPLPWRPVSDRAIRPPHLLVWVRVEGAWRRGWVWAWEREDAGWRVWVHYEQERRVWSTFAWFRYDPEAIRRRESEDPP